jgi:hypothetical protein
MPQELELPPPPDVEEIYTEDEVSIVLQIFNCIFTDTAAILLLKDLLVDIVIDL